MKSLGIVRSVLPVFAIAFALPICATLALERAGSAAGPAASGFAPKFVDAKKQTAEFVGYSSSIKLTAAQKDMRDRVLGAMSAPCCKKFSMATCCCPCNLAKSVWGLSNSLIVKGADAKAIQTAVSGWLAFSNPGGFSGVACDVPAGCQRAIHSDGCGGMSENNVIASR